MKTATPPKTTVLIRWMIRRDLPDVIGIELQSYATTWSEDDFLKFLRQRNCIGMVAEYQGKIVAFMIYEMQKSSLCLLNLAVDPTYRRSGVGTQMVAKLLDKLIHNHRNRVTLHISERNLDGQLFFAGLGFEALRVVRGCYEPISDEDAYLMEYHNGREVVARPTEEGAAHE